MSRYDSRTGFIREENRVLIKASCKGMIDPVATVAVPIRAESAK